MSPPRPSSNPPVGGARGGARNGWVGAARAIGVDVVELLLVWVLGFVVGVITATYLGTMVVLR